MILIIRMNGSESKFKRFLNAEEFLDLYNKRVAVEQTIYHLKSYMGSDVIWTYDHISIFSDFLLSAITYSLLFILVHNISKPQCFKLTIKNLINLKKLTPLKLYLLTLYLQKIHSFFT